MAVILFPVIIVAGFARTYYFKGLFAGPPLPSTLVHVHGLLMSAWVALFATQVWLVSSRRVRLHQRLGYAGAGLGLLIIPVGLFTALHAAKYSPVFGPPGVPPTAFLIVPLLDLVMFVLLFGGAIYFRKHPATNKRLMLLAAINFLPPALARIPIAPLLAAGPLWFFGLPAVIALLCVALDARQNGRLHRLFLAGAVALIASYVVRLAAVPTDAWMSIAERLVASV